MELRCPQGKLFGLVVDGLLEVRCRSKFCGDAPGVVIIHRFDLVTGETRETRHFKDPTPQVKGTSNGCT